VQMDRLLWIYVFLLMAGGVGIAMVRQRILEEADQKLPEGEKIQHTFWNRTGLKSGEMSRAWQTHRQFFPTSSLRFWYVALWVCSVSWMFCGPNLLKHVIR
jgi:hypothetical protein